MEISPFHRFEGSRGLPIGSLPDQLYEKQQLEHARQSQVEYSTHVIEVDSSQRDRVRFSSSNDFRIYFRNPLTNIVRVDLAFAQVPNVSFNVDSTNSLFALEEIVGNSAPRVIRFSLREGHYDITDLSEELTRLLNLHSSSTASPYVVDSLSRQNKVSFKASHDVTRFRILFGESTCSSMLGFDAQDTPYNDTMVSDDPVYSGALVSSGYVDTTGDHHVLLSSPELDTSMHEVSYSPSGEGLVSAAPPNCFGRIALVGDAGSLVTYSGGVSGYLIFKEFRPPIARLDSLHLRWLRQDGSPADFQNLDNTIKLHFRQHPACAQLKKLRMLVKSASRKSPGLMFNRFREALLAEGVMDAINDHDMAFFAEHDAQLSPVPGLFLQGRLLSPGEVERLWAAVQALVESTSADDVLVAGGVADESGWSELVSEIISQHVLLPACLREKVSGILALLVQFLEGQTQDELSADLDGLLDGVDLSAVLPRFSGLRPENDPEHRDRSIDGSLLKDLLPHLRSLRSATEREALETARGFLRSESMKGVVRVFRRAFRCVDSGMLVRLLSDAVESLDVSSIPALIASVNALQEDPRMLRGVSMLTRTANVPALQALVQDAAQLVDPSVMQRVVGGTGAGGGNVLSSLLSTSVTPDLVSRLPSMINRDGSIDMTAVPGLIRGQRRRPRKPRLTASRLAS
ncbi:hypothetical protein KFL_007120085 [Klebsormidium nitens]|uniref:DUF5901 domain-containing protein n=1 Tax=Klebsormidium nitens TaxID=105231 RepID=A0A1Y1IJP6_KLENI|nr:hypothetical protein KFL_007120085 [Klebsormidium nitens]|eukprot:GAQ91004.1 hypothetical protein KFL_007120085 [Klebsormidium nitens]